MAIASLNLNLAGLASSLPSLSGSRSSSIHGSSPASAFAPVASAKCSCRRPLTTLMMAKRELELGEIRKMSDEEINNSVVELKGELLLLRMKRTARQDVKSSEFGRMHKRIARMLTIRRERELEQGIKKRESRKLDRAWKRSIVVKPPTSLTAILAKKDDA